MKSKKALTNSRLLTQEVAPCRLLCTKQFGVPTPVQSCPHPCQRSISFVYTVVCCVNSLGFIKYSANIPVL